MAAGLKQRIVASLLMTFVVLSAKTSATDSSGSSCLQNVVTRVNDIRKDFNLRLKMVESQADQCSNDSPDPSSGWQFSSVTQKHYRVIFELVDRQKAVSRCTELGGNARLVVVNNQVENEVIKDILRSLDPNLARICDGPDILYPGYGGFWTSGQRIDSSSCASTEWVWRPRPGVTLPVSYTNWFYGEPNCGYDNEHCIQFGSATFENFRWNDINCGWPLCPLCEMTN